MWLNESKFLIVIHRLAKFSIHRPSVSSGTAAKILILVTFQDHMIKGSGDFMEGNSTLYIPFLPKLIAIDIVLMAI